MWIDRQGRKEPLFFDAPPAGQLGSVLLSPVGDLLEVETGGATDQIWIHDLARRTSTRLTFEWDNGFAAWSPDGERIAFGSNRHGQWNLYAMSVGGSEEVERLTTSPYTQTVRSWLPDGKTLLYEESHPETGDDLWLLRFEGDPVPEPFLRTSFDENNPRVSPDGRFVAYESNESGRREVYIRSLGDSASKTQVSTAGGGQLRWRRDGMEVFYWQQATLMAVAVSERDGSLALGKPVAPFEDEAIRRVS